MVRFDRKRQTGVFEFNTKREHLSSQLTRQIRSHKDMQGINGRICNELDAGNAEHDRKKEIQMKFFLKGEQACKREMQEHRETKENFI